MLPCRTIHKERQYQVTCRRYRNFMTQRGEKVAQHTSRALIWGIAMRGLHVFTDCCAEMGTHASPFARTNSLHLSAEKCMNELTPLILDITTAISFKGCLSNEKDHTFYWEVERLKREHGASLVGAYLRRMECVRASIQAGEATQTLGTSIDDSAVLRRGSSNLQQVRANLCLSHQGKLLSGTFRDAKFDPSAKEPFHYDFNWTCASTIPGALIQPQSVASCILDKINYLQPGSNTAPSGLILLAGSTKSGKSYVARALALEAIRRNIQGRLSPIVKSRISESQFHNRLPHLVTYEDPIEQWTLNGRSLLWSQGEPESLSCVKHGFCFTPRQKGIDTLCLEDAVSDAKRQTPTCFYVGEIRKQADWRTLIDFARSGHLVIATTHASSLVELFATLLRVTKASNPVDRRSVLSQLLAGIHLQLRDEVRDVGKLLVPTVWFRSGTTLSNIVGDGLSAIIPDGNHVLGHRDSLDVFLDRDLDATARKAALLFGQSLDAAEVRRQ